MNNTAGISIQSTAGAVPVRNDKGEVSMQKVKVHRYVSGKRPDYAPMSSSEEESEDDDFIEQKRRHISGRPISPTEAMEQDVEATGDVEVDDPRLRRLKTRKADDQGEESEDENRIERHRHIHAPEILETGGSDEERDRRRMNKMIESEEEEEEDELSDEEIERRRQMLRQKVMNKKDDETTVKDNDEPSLNDVNTDDENDEVEYEAWKLRELKRIKRDREEREQVERERLEIERLRNMTEEERRQELRNNPKFVTNKATKGKYKFLQKYYHRGAFFMNHDDDLYKRDFSAATLEDHFDKTILPKVMQVKNFGRSGRTKYTHLVDQDTTQFDSPWISETAQNLKFHNNQAAGMKQVFDRPTTKRSK
ncbi:Microfibrillar-associated protein 1 [Blattella germanica]|nr:Microfibrillar-associated protein 1 [Blattella germanica]